MKFPKFGFNRNDNTDDTVWLENIKETGETAKSKYVGIWRTSERFLRGCDIDYAYLHSSDINSILSLEEFIPDIESFGYSHMTNIILPLARQASAVISSNFSSIKVKPASTDEEDIKAALLAYDFIKSRDNIDNEKTLRQNELLTNMTYGECMRYTRYNPNKITADGVLGDIETISLDPSQYCRSTDGFDSSKPSWVCMTEVMDVDVLKEMYPGKDIRGQDIKQTRYGEMGKTEYVSKENKRCIVNRMYFRESISAPKGMYFVWTGKTLLQKNDSLPDGIFPFVVYQWFVTPGQDYAMGFVEPLIKPQLTINVSLTKENVLSRKIINPDLILEGDYDVVTEELENGQKVIRVPYGRNSVQFLKYPSDISICENLKQSAELQSLDIAGIRETSLGRQQRESTATQTAMLKDSDNIGLYSFKERIDDAFCEVCKIKLHIAQKYFKEKRIIKSIGRANESYMQYFYGADLKGYYDIEAVKIPFVSAAMEQQIKTNLMQKGVFAPTDSAELLYSNMTMVLNSGLPNADDIVREYLGDDLTYSQLGEIAQSIRSQKMKLEIGNLSLMDINQELQAQQFKGQYQSMANPQTADQNNINGAGMEPAPQAGMEPVNNGTQVPIQ